VLAAEYDCLSASFVHERSTARVVEMASRGWTGTQAPGMTRNRWPRRRLSQGDVTLRKQYLGGLWPQGETEWRLQPAKLPPACGQAVKVIWTREADIAADLFGRCPLRVARGARREECCRYSATAAVGQLHEISHTSVGRAPSFILTRRRSKVGRRAI